MLSAAFLKVSCSAKEAHLSEYLFPKAIQLTISVSPNLVKEITQSSSQPLPTLLCDRAYGTYRVHRHRLHLKPSPPLPPIPVSVSKKMADSPAGTCKPWNIKTWRVLKINTFLRPENPPLGNDQAFPGRHWWPEVRHCESIDMKPVFFTNPGDPRVSDVYRSCCNCVQSNSVDAAS